MVTMRNANSGSVRCLGGVGCLGILALALAVSGCTQIQKYPENWALPDTTLTGGCSAFTGSYSETDSGGSQIGLVHILSGYQREPQETADRVVLMEPARGRLQLVAYRQKKVVAEFQYSESDRTLVCGASEVVLVIHQGLLADQGGLGYSKVFVSLYRDTNGNLVVKRYESSAGAYGIIPIAGKSTGWYLFRPLYGVTD